MQVSEQILQEINNKSFSLSNKHAVVGLDGFVDKIVAPVEKRLGLGDQFEPVSTIAEMGAKISARLARVPISSFIHDLRNSVVMDRSWPTQCYHWEWMSATLELWVIPISIPCSKNLPRKLKRYPLRTWHHHRSRI